MSDEMKEKIKQLCEKVSELDAEEQRDISLLAHGMALQKELMKEKQEEAE